MKVAIFGAGSVGCFVGGAWQAAGLDVAFVGRERIGADIAENGLVLTDSAGWRTRLAPEAVDFSTQPAALKAAEIILLTVKSNDTEAAAKEISRNARKGATILSFQNGVSNAETLRAALGKRFKVAQGMVPFNVAYLGSGRFHKGVAGELVAEDGPITRALAERIGARGPATLRLATDMPSIAWGKLLINLNNAVNALSGRTLLDQLRERDYRRVVAASIIEALGVLEAAGIEPAKVGPVPPRLLPHVIGAPNAIFALFLKAQKIDAAARSSMADDLAAARPTEIDYLNGEVVKLGKKLNRPTPVNGAIVNLIRQREAGVEHLWSPAELRARIQQGSKVAPLFGY
ncbi:MAG TPA: 2-dehydropantoate 2-reductase [Allosphingosinicella sp.]|nr:2-dehydropantoate 2-reductase [Allosphingosinicella sp.]